MPAAARGQADRRPRRPGTRHSQFLIDWKCGVNKLNTPPMLASWIRDSAGRVEALAHLTIADPQILEHLGEIQAVYDSLWEEARASVRTWARLS